LIAGDLTLSSQRVDLRHIHTPVLAVINPRGRVVPARSALEGLALTRGLTTILEYGGEAGTVLEHIGALIGPRAHAQLWPRIMEWTRAIA
jgi:polyhydroxyalkanoate synthase